MAGTVSNFPIMGSMKAQGFYSFELTIPDDDFYEFTPVGISGFIELATTSTTTFGKAWFRTSGAAVKAYGGANFAANSGPLDGTTGVDGQVTVGSGGGFAYIENRAGSTQTFTVQLTCIANDSTE